MSENDKELLDGALAAGGGGTRRPPARRTCAEWKHHTCNDASNNTP